MQVEKRWVIKAGEKFLRIDAAISQDFYYVDFWDCRKFLSLKDAQNWLAYDWGNLKFIEWEIYSVDEIGAKFVQGEIKTPYEIELAELKQKYGIK